MRARAGVREDGCQKRSSARCKTVAMTATCRECNEIATRSGLCRQHYDHERRCTDHQRCLRARAFRAARLALPEGAKKPPCRECGLAPVHAKDLCKKHYDAAHRGTGPTTRVARQREPCSECDAPAYARGRCRPHYDGLRRSGGPSTDWADVKCPECGGEAPKRNGRQAYCSARCRKRAKMQRRADRRRAQGLPRHNRKVPLAPVVTRTCEICFTDFETSHSKKVTCSQRCSDTRKWRLKDHRKGHRRRARHFGVPYEHVDRVEVFEHDNWLCGICGEAVDSELAWPDPGCAVLDHIVPISVSGSPGHVPTNLQCAHNRCNLRKSDDVDPELLAALSV